MTTTNHTYAAGRLCLDLTGTIGAAMSSTPVERLETPDRLRQWLIGAGLLTGTEHTPLDQEWLDTMRELRTLVDRIVHDTLNDQVRDADIRRINTYAEPAPPRKTLRRTTAGLKSRFVPPVTLPAITSSISGDLIDLLTGPSRQFLRQCDGDHCALVYIDTSRGHRRRWCSSSSCGNRNRVARHRERAAPTKS